MCCSKYAKLKRRSFDVILQECGHLATLQMTFGIPLVQITVDGPKGPDVMYVLVCFMYKLYVYMSFTIPQGFSFICILAWVINDNSWLFLPWRAQPGVVRTRTSACIYVLNGLSVSIAHAHHKTGWHSRSNSRVCSIQGTYGYSEYAQKQTCNVTYTQQRYDNLAASLHCMWYSGNVWCML